MEFHYQIEKRVQQSHKASSNRNKLHTFFLNNLRHHERTNSLPNIRFFQLWATLLYSLFTCLTFQLLNEDNKPRISWYTWPSQPLVSAAVTLETTINASNSKIIWDNFCPLARRRPHSIARASTSSTKYWPCRYLQQVARTLPSTSLITTPTLEFPSFSDVAPSILILKELGGGAIHFSSVLAKPWKQIVEALLNSQIYFSAKHQI